MCLGAGTGGGGGEREVQVDECTFGLMGAWSGAHPGEAGHKRRLECQAGFIFVVDPHPLPLARVRHVLGSEAASWGSRSELSGEVSLCSPGRKRKCAHCPPTG